MRIACESIFNCCNSKRESEKIATQGLTPLHGKTSKVQQRVVLDPHYLRYTQLKHMREDRAVLARSPSFLDILTKFEIGKNSLSAGQVGLKRHVRVETIPQ